MGAGKSSAAIRYMNEHARDKRFIYITPFLEETERIQQACPKLKFVLPNQDKTHTGVSKSAILKELLASGRNVSISHALFSICDRDTISVIRDAGYTIIIDEVLEVLEQHAASNFEVTLFKDAGYLIGGGECVDGEYEYYTWADDKPIPPGSLGTIALLARCHKLTNVANKIEGDKRTFFYWSLHEDLLKVAEDTFILTYLFNGSPMKGYLEINGMEYDIIGVEHRADGSYHFSDRPTLPALAGQLKDLIHVVEHDKLNQIGDSEFALSSSWYKEARTHKRTGNLDRIRKDLHNYFRNIAPKGSASEDRMWCAFKGVTEYLRGPGYSHADVPVTSRATNKYRNRYVCAYCANIFLNPAISAYFKRNGVAINEDLYALSNLVQWIFRSAIRDGKEIWLYIPSKRMRTLLQNWLNELYEASLQQQEGGVAA